MLVADAEETSQRLRNDLWRSLEPVLHTQTVCGVNSQILKLRSTANTGLGEADSSEWENQTIRFTMNLVWDVYRMHDGRRHDGEIQTTPNKKILYKDGEEFSLL